MKQERKKELRRLNSMANSLFYACDELMGKMERENEHGCDVAEEDKAAYIVIGRLAQFTDEYRWKLEDLLDEQNKKNEKC